MARVAVIERQHDGALGKSALALLPRPERPGAHRLIAQASQLRQERVKLLRTQAVETIADLGGVSPLRDNVMKGQGYDSRRHRLVSSVRHRHIVSGSPRRSAAGRTATALSGGSPNPARPVSWAAAGPAAH